MAIQLAGDFDIHVVPAPAGIQFFANPVATTKLGPGLRRGDER